MMKREFRATATCNQTVISYRIRPTHQMNVDELNERGVRTVSYCFGPEGELPIGDVMLAQKIALENDEQAALALANRGNPHQSPPRFG